MWSRLIVAVCFSVIAASSWAACAETPQGQSETKRVPDSPSSSLTVRDHFGRFIKATVDWKTLAGPAATAAGSQLFTSHYGFSNDWSGYGKHYGVNVLGNVSGKFIGNFAMPAIFHQDEQLAALGETSRWQDRLGHVFVHLIFTRSADHSGATAFNASAIPGAAINALLSNTYQPSRQRSAVATAQRFGWNIAGFVAGDAYTEFHCDLGKLVPWFKCRRK